MKEKFYSLIVLCFVVLSFCFQLTFFMNKYLSNVSNVSTERVGSLIKLPNIEVKKDRPSSTTKIGDSTVVQIKTEHELDAALQTNKNYRENKLPPYLMEPALSAVVNDELSNDLLSDSLLKRFNRTNENNELLANLPVSHSLLKPFNRTNKDNELSANLSLSDSLLKAFKKVNDYNKISASSPVSNFLFKSFKRTNESNEISPILKVSASLLKPFNRTYKDNKLSVNFTVSDSLFKPLNRTNKDIELLVNPAILDSLSKLFKRNSEDNELLVNTVVLDSLLKLFNSSNEEDNPLPDLPEPNGLLKPFKKSANVTKSDVVLKPVLKKGGENKLAANLATSDERWKQFNRNDKQKEESNNFTVSDDLSKQYQRHAIMDDFADNSVEKNISTGYSEKMASGGVKVATDSKTSNKEKEPKTGIPLLKREALYKSRRNRIDRFCAEYRKNQTIWSSIEMEDHPPHLRVHVNDERKLLWNEVPKAASSTWRHYFVEMINGREDVNVEVNDKHSLLEYWKSSMSNGYLSFMIARHPFARIVSAYRNKLEGSHLGAVFYQWKEMYGDYIVQKYRSKDKKQSMNTESCTFSEFVTFLVHHYLIDPHLLPITRVAYPCELSYTVIAKIETMEEDTKYLLEKAGARELYSTKWRNHSKGTNEEYYYKQISKQQMMGLYDTYRTDFELFDYDLDEYLKYVKD